MKLHFRNLFLVQDVHKKSQYLIYFISPHGFFPSFFLLSLTKTALESIAPLFLNSSRVRLGARLGLWGGNATI
jgi:hypothetical protein